MTDAASPRPKRSLFSLITDLPGLLRGLVRGEIEQLKRELKTKIAQAGVGIGLVVAAAAIAFFALGVFIAAAVLGLSELLPPWAAALIVAGVLVLIAAILIAVGISQIKRGASAPEDSISSIKKDVQVIKGIKKPRV